MTVIIVKYSKIFFSSLKNFSNIVNHKGFSTFFFSEDRLTERLMACQWSINNTDLFFLNRDRMNIPSDMLDLYDYEKI